MSRKQRNRLKNDFLGIQQPTSLARDRDNSSISIFSKILELSSYNTIDWSRKNIKKWRSAMESFLDPTNPTPADLQDIYTDLAFDAHLQSQLELRKMNILNAEFALYDDKAQVDVEATNLIAKSWLFNLISDYMDAIFFGASIVEISAVDSKTGSIEYNVIPRRNTCISKNLIFLDRTNSIDYTLPQFTPYIIQLGEDHLGIMNNIIPDLIWKRHTKQAWATFIDRFGLPWITVTTSKSDKKTQDDIENKTKLMGQGATAVLPTGTSIDLKQPQNTDAYNVFKAMIDSCDQNISKQVVGGTMLSDNGSSRSQSEVHERNLTERISLADMRGFQFFFNDQLIPLLNTYHGFKLNHTFAFDTTKEVELKDLFNIVQGLSSSFEINQEWISKTFNIPIDGKKTPALPINNTATAQISKKKIHSQPPIAIYGNVRVPIIISQYDSELYRLQELLTSFIHSGQSYNATIAQKAIATYNILSQALAKNFKGIEHSQYNQPDYKCYQAMQTNIFRFSAAKQIHLAQQMNSALLDENGVRRSFADFKKNIDKMGIDYDVNYLNTEYNFATVVGQNAANYWRQQADKKNIPFVQYHTMGDSRVRDGHQILNGKIFSLDDPFLSRIYPPNGWGCRCELVQYPQGSSSNASQAASLINQADINPEFQINRAITKEVFAQNQSYLKTISNTDIEKLNDLSYSDYNRPSTIKGNSSLGTLKEVSPEFDKNNKAIYKDYLGRQIILDKSNYSLHTQGKYLQEKRHLYASKIQEVLEHPTEVYLKYYNNQPSMRYIKYYDDGTSLIVQTGFENDTHIVGTWFKNDKGNDNRQGYLIKKAKE